MTLRTRYALSFAAGGAIFGALLSLGLRLLGALSSAGPAWLWPWGVSAVGALAAGLGAYLVLGKLLRPFRRAGSFLQEIRAFDQRLPEPRSEGELRTLVTGINAMLARLQDAAKRERAFLATASHEIRRPLAALRGELELAVSRRRTPQALRESIAMALVDAERMSRLVDDLLFHARARAGALRLKERLVSVVEVVYEAIDRSQRAMTGASGISVGGLPDLELRADPEALGQVFENLVVNAHTHGGEHANVFIAGRRTPAALELFVQDDGPGIPAEEQDRVFDAFGRGDRSSSVAGAGLGLAIAREIVRSHAGDLRLDSPAPGQGSGTRFTVVLPASRIVESGGGELA